MCHCSSRFRTVPGCRRRPSRSVVRGHTSIVRVCGKGSGRVSICGLVCYRPARRSRLIYRTMTPPRPPGLAERVPRSRLRRPAGRHSPYNRTPRSCWSRTGCGHVTSPKCTLRRDRTVSTYRMTPRTLLVTPQDRLGDLPSSCGARPARRGLPEDCSAAAPRVPSRRSCHDSPRDRR